jgi:hypothetical protein
MTFRVVLALLGALALSTSAAADNVSVGPISRLFAVTNGSLSQTDASTGAFDSVVVGWFELLPAYHRCFHVR